MWLTTCSVICFLTCIGICFFFDLFVDLFTDLFIDSFVVLIDVLFVDFFLVVCGFACCCVLICSIDLFVRWFVLASVERAGHPIRRTLPICECM